MAKRSSLKGKTASSDSVGRRGRASVTFEPAVLVVNEDDADRSHDADQGPLPFKQFLRGKLQELERAVLDAHAQEPPGPGSPPAKLDSSSSGVIVAAPFSLQLAGCTQQSSSHHVSAVNAERHNKPLSQQLSGCSHSDSVEQSGARRARPVVFESADTDAGSAPLPVSTSPNGYAQDTSDSPSTSSWDGKDGRDGKVNYRVRRSFQEINEAEPLVTQGVDDDTDVVAEATEASLPISRGLLVTPWDLQQRNLSRPRSSEKLQNQPQANRKEKRVATGFVRLNEPPPEEAEEDASENSSDGNGCEGGRASVSFDEATKEDMECEGQDDTDAKQERDINKPTEQLKLRSLWGGAAPRLSQGRPKSKYTQMVMTTITQIAEDAEAKSMKRKAIGRKTLGKSARKSTRNKQVQHGAHCCVISPMSKRWMMWEIFGVILLGYDLILTPMQVFDIPSNIFLESTGMATTIYWTTCMLATFFVGYQVKNQATIVFDLKLIFRNYCKGWFPVDCFIVVTDWAGMLLQIYASNSSSLGYTRMARFARLGRLLRTMRLLRVLRVGDFLQQLEAMINSEYISMMILVGCNVFCICFLAHVVACLWFYIGDVNQDDSWVIHTKLYEKPFGEQYLDALGWSLSTLLSSTMTYITAQTKLEYILALVILVVGTITISLVFSSTTAAMTRIQQLRAEERDASWKLKSYLKQNAISPTLAARVIRYVEIAKKVHRTRIAMSNVTLITLLSGPLRIELQMELYAPPLVSHSFFENYQQISMGAMGELCLRAVSTLSLSRGDVLFRCFSDASNMFFLLGGVMVYRRAKGAKSTRNTATVNSGSSFCEPTLWLPWIHHGSMAALMESDVLTLDSEMFCKITEGHHDVYLEARLYAARYLDCMNDLLQRYGYVWDISFDMMYADHDFDEHSHKGGPLVHALQKAEAMSAEIMAFDSDTDEEDEKNLQKKLLRTSSFFVDQNQQNQQNRSSWS